VVIELAFTFMVEPKQTHAFLFISGNG